MNVTKTISLSLKDTYQMLISECRYGYGRNNHLMPDGAYDKVKRIVPQMYEVDQEYAVYTLKQICEECITDQIVWNFSDGYDDEFGNRGEAIEFVKWCMKWIHEHGDPDYKPCCWDRFEDNLSKDDELRYVVYEMVDGKKKLITPDPVSIKVYPDYIFTKENMDDKGMATFHRIMLPEDNVPYGKTSIKYEFLNPTNKVYIVEHI